MESFLSHVFPFSRAFCLPQPWEQGILSLKEKAHLEPNC